MIDDTRDLFFSFTKTQQKVFAWLGFLERGCHKGSFPFLFILMSNKKVFWFWSYDYTLTTHACIPCRAVGMIYFSRADDLVVNVNQDQPNHRFRVHDRGQPSSCFVWNRWRVTLDPSCRRELSHSGSTSLTESSVA